MKNAEKVLKSLNEEDKRENIRLNVVQQNFFPEEVVVESGTDNCGAGMGMSPSTNKCSKSILDYGNITKYKQERKMVNYNLAWVPLAKNQGDLRFQP